MAGGSSGASGSAGSPTDAGGDAWATNPTAWKTPPWNPPGCNVPRAVDLAKDLPPLSWVPCNDGVKGCVLMNASLLPGAGSFNPNMKLGALAGVHRYGTRTIFTVGVAFGEYGGAEVMYELGKGPIAASRTTDGDSCHMGRAYLWTGGVLQQTNLAPDGGLAQLIRSRSVDQLVADTARSLRMDGTVTGTQQHGDSPRLAPAKSFH